MVESTCNMAGRCVAASILLRHSADLGAKDAGGNIPLHCAAVGRRGLAVERRGPNVRNNAGGSPVDSADCPGGNVSFGLLCMGSRLCL